MLGTIRMSPSGAALNMILFSIWVMVLSGSALGCPQKTVDDYQGKKEMAAKTIEAVLKEHTDEWMSIPGVVGTGIGECEGKPCIRIFVVKRTPELLKKIPSELEGFVVDVQETGEIRARDST